MFGMGFGELVLVIIVAIVMIGPKDLPRVLRTAGQWAGKIRRMALDLRVQSGIDDVLRNEGLTEDLHEIRKLARGELDGIRAAATINPEPAPAAAEDAYPGLSMSALRHREYPREGADSYGALPDTAVVYSANLATSELARDPLYVTGDPNGVLPELPPEPERAPKADDAPGASTDGAAGAASSTIPGGVGAVDALAPKGDPATESAPERAETNGEPLRTLAGLAAPAVGAPETETAKREP